MRPSPWQAIEVRVQGARDACRYGRHLVEAESARLRHSGSATAAPACASIRRIAPSVTRSSRRAPSARAATFWRVNERTWHRRLRLPAWAPEPSIGKVVPAAYVTVSLAAASRGHAPPAVHSSVSPRPRALPIAPGSSERCRHGDGRPGQFAVVAGYPSWPTIITIYAAPPLPIDVSMREAGTLPICAKPLLPRLSVGRPTRCRSVRRTSRQHGLRYNAGP
ncbi:hypothetical protein AURDEDRAFT_128673 [Auricularia subglabra TFB-10046 SS5]|nr:hypothetical protein AURDEDRAFT_128673 [Auricularia subglabra TFB-10046 SS5]